MFNVDAAFIDFVRIDQRLLAHADGLFKSERRFEGLSPLPDLIQRAGAIATDRSHQDRVPRFGFNKFSEIDVSAQPSSINYVRLTFSAAEKELLRTFEGMDVQWITVGTLALPYPKIRGALGLYQESMTMEHEGVTSIRLFEAKDRFRYESHDSVMRMLFPSPINTAGYFTSTERKIVSIIGLLFPKGPFEALLRRDQNLSPPPEQPGLKYEGGYAVFDKRSIVASLA